MNPQADEELSSLRLRIADRPADLGLRFALGELLFRRHDYAQAITELQKAMYAPQLRRSAGKLIADAFDARKMPDAAAGMRRLVAGDDPDNDGSAPVFVPVVPRPPTLPDAAAREIPRDENA